LSIIVLLLVVVDGCCVVARAQAACGALASRSPRRSSARLAAVATEQLSSALETRRLALSGDLVVEGWHGRG
jgi:hypothetical protein